MTDNRPDLPELESVRAGSTGMIPSVVIGLPLLIGAAYLLVSLYLEYRNTLGEDAFVASVGVGIIAGLVLYVSIRCVCGDFVWETSSEGIAVRSLVRRRFIRWTHFRNTNRAGYRGSTRLHRFDTACGRLDIPARIPRNGWQEQILFASIWLHLRRHGKAEVFGLPQVASSLWDEIPEAVPHEIAWTDPSPRRQAASLIGCLLVFVMFGSFAAYLIAGGSVLLGVMLLVFGAAIAALSYRTELRHTLVMPKRLWLDDAQITAEFARRSLVLSWAEISGAAWNTTGPAACLELRGRCRSSMIAIPLVLQNTESCLLVLAIIRRLRTAGVPHLLPIPPVLRARPAASSMSLPAKSGMAELRFAASEERMTLMLPFVVVGLLGIANRLWRHDASPADIAVLIVIPLVAWVSLSSYVFRVDKDGISKRFLFWRYLVSWARVAGVRVINPSQRLYQTLLLLDGKGKVLMDATVAVGSLEDRERFEAVLNAYLVRILPSNQLDEPWKSRPWNNDELAPTRPT